MNAIHRLARKYKSFKIMILSLIVLSIMVKPVLFAVGEIHELSDNPSGYLQSHTEAILDDTSHLSAHKSHIAAHAAHLLTHLAHSCDHPNLGGISYAPHVHGHIRARYMYSLGQSQPKSVAPALLLRPPINS
jgi:hypothetical protein